MIKNEAAWCGVKRLLSLQIVVTVCLSFGYLFDSFRASYSAVLGGVVCILPTLYFATKIFKHAGARAAPKIIQALYWGEAVKIILSVGLFALIFLTVKLSASAFFVTFVVVQLSFWVAPWLFTIKQKQ